ncbi:MAG: LacI family transcriptional regulator [Chitinophagaceae bacterium]|nr:LacI family transcriptional regulator [Chitinophagaceae bacterium]
MKPQNKPLKQKNSIREIAEALQLSPATISRVLNNHPYVHEDTRKKVQRMIQEKGYQRNVMASGLRTNKTYTIGLIVPRISMFYHTRVITSIQNQLYKQGYNLIISQSNDLVEMEKELTRTLYASRVDGVIVSCTLFTNHFDHFDILTQNNIPVIFYDRVPMESYPACIIKGDDFRGAYLAASHLLELGAKRIAFINGPLSCNLYVDRFKGFEAAMKQYGVPILKKHIFYHELTEENARKSLHELFAHPPFPDAVFAANDLTAITTLQFAREIGIQVPQTLRIVGYSNDPRTSITTPSITTVNQFPDETGRIIVRELLKLLKAPQPIAADQKPIIAPVELIRRMST